ncbi:UDP-4-amino-4,6-dideoxy-N-acetyl-beta-L-altrosamine transaminase [Polynucleobacter paneuropaeus]|nr:UDP-4-amino-4,6-dideoxy-N-acetyl-beta-L-altrosamine transaminase [Polynucleobacter paneuropaeus]
MPYGRQNISTDDIQAVIEVLRSDYLTQGQAVPEFENAICLKVGARYGVAANSATSALHMACLALGLGVGDVVWTSPNSFVASANCALYCGAKVDFVDINPATYNLDVDLLEQKLKNAKINSKIPKIIIPVHFAGRSCDMKRIYELSLIYGFKIIEDASHAIGGKYLDAYIGSCKYSDITVFSFHPVKIITTGEGGVALTNSSRVAESMRLFRSHGITRESENFTCKHSNDGDWYYEQNFLGYNYRMTDIQAALGISQLKSLEKFIFERENIVQWYNFNISSLDIVLPIISPDVSSANHLYVIRVKQDRSRIFRELKNSGIGVNVHYIPIHLQPYYRKMGFRYGDYPNAENYYEEAISLPIYPGLNLQEMVYIKDRLLESLGS